MNWPFIEAGELMARRSGSVNPAKFPDELFELHSIPAFDTGHPELLRGSQIGSSKQIVQPNDVMISKIVPHIRRSAVVKPASGPRQIASGEWIVFRSERVFPDYLRHVLISDHFHSKFMTTVSGVGGSLLRARPAEVAKIKIPLPPLPEQRRIAAILDKADTLRAKRREVIAKLDQLLQSVFLEMFGDPMTNPKGWPRRPLDELVVIDAPLVDPLEERYQRLLHYGPDRIEKNSGRLLEAKTAKEDGQISKKFLCDTRHILYSKIRPYLNKVALVTDHCLCSADVYPVEPKEQLTRRFLWHILRSVDFLDHAAFFSNRANIPKINRDQFLQYECIVPPRDIQNKFEEISKRFEALEADAETAKLSTERLFATLQCQAFEERCNPQKINGVSHDNQ